MTITDLKEILDKKEIQLDLGEKESQIIEIKELDGMKDILVIVYNKDESIESITRWKDGKITAIEV